MSAESLHQRIKELERENKGLERENKGLERENKELERENEDLRREKRESTFNEVLEYYHEYSKNIKVETDRKKSTQGETTSPQGRSCPTILKEWTSFPAEYDAAMARVLDTLQRDNDEIRCFESKIFIKQLIDRETKEKLASEEDLRIQSHILLDMPTSMIASELARLWDRGAKVVFRNHDNFDEEMLHAQHSHDAATAEAGPDLIEFKKKSVPIDQICLLDDGNEHMQRLFLAGLKPPHKMTVDTMYSGLDKEINLPNDIINSLKIPHDPHEKHVYTSKQMVCAAITQAYDYMLRSPIMYACVITGETIVFLRIDGKDTNILHHYLIEPLQAVKAAAEIQKPFPFHNTALAHMVAFTVLAFDAPELDHNWQTKAISKSAKWKVDPDVLLSQLHEEQTKETPPPSIARIRF
ncbi:MAG: hypothetical protein OHK93_003327 [Ramalina farinacea]|uniref:Uncharacterized protein n=1 Tax=Ramalina farinacea TaxID=258253 RepID=A0AA43QT68_9LECA|nr:hypothetical protein [Ramalina farinacea]